MIDDQPLQQARALLAPAGQRARQRMPRSTAGIPTCCAGCSSADCADSAVDARKATGTTIREGQIVGPLDAWLARVFSPDRRHRRQLDRRSPGHRLRAKTTLARATNSKRTTRTQIHSLVDQLGSIMTTLAHSQPEHRAEVYGQLGLPLTHQPDGKVVRAEATPPGPGARDRVRGGT